MSSSKKYVNEAKNFSSYFLSFGDGARLELMHSPGIEEQAASKKVTSGYAHIAISVGSKEAVDHLTELLGVQVSLYQESRELQVMATTKV